MGSWNQFNEWLEKYLDFTVIGSDKLSNKWVKHKGYGIVKCAKVALVAGTDTGGGIFSWANPEDGAIQIVNLQVDVTTAATGACDLDAGAGASATGDYATLIAAADIGTAAVQINSANSALIDECPEGGYVTGTTESGASAGLVGSAYITYAQIAN